MKFIQVVLVFSFVAMSVAFAHQASGADRSQAGPQASAVTVPPRPTPTIPEGNAGLAAKYAGDVGIERDPDVVFVESFEDSVDEICRHWESVAGKPIMSSLHAGWAAWCGLVVLLLATRPWLRALAVAYPACTVLVTVLTANHYLLDAVAGFAVLAVAYAAVRVGEAEQCRAALPQALRASA